jgi:hypothetical protein
MQSQAETSPVSRSGHAQTWKLWIIIGKSLAIIVNSAAWDCMTDAGNGRAVQALRGPTIRRSSNFAAHEVVLSRQLWHGRNLCGDLGRLDTDL